MKLAIKIPHSLDLTLSAIARALADQNAVIDTFIILCDLVPDTGTLHLNYFNDIDCIFSVKLIKKSLSLSVTCPQIAKQTQLVKYTDGDFATIHITNKTSLNPVNKKDKVIELQTKLHCESFFYTNGGTFKVVRPHHGLISLTDMPLFLYAYKLPTPSSLVTSSVPHTVLPPMSSLSTPHIAILSSLQPHGVKTHYTTAAHDIPSLITSTSTTNAPTPCIGELSIHSPVLPNISNHVYCPRDTKRQSTPLSQDGQEEDILQDISVNHIPSNILNFNPSDPIPSLPNTSTDPLYAFQLTPVSEHLDPTNPEQFRIDFSSIPTSVEPLIPTIPPNPNPVPLEQQGHSTQHLQGVEGAHALPQSEAVVLASNSNGHTPTNISESIVSADNSITSDMENDTTQVENAQQHTHGAIASDSSRQQRNVIITETVMNQFLNKIVSVT